MIRSAGADLFATKKHKRHKWSQLLDCFLCLFVARVLLK